MYQHFKQYRTLKLLCRYWLANAISNSYYFLSDNMCVSDFVCLFFRSSAIIYTSREPRCLPARNSFTI